MENNTNSKFAKAFDRTNKFLYKYGGLLFGFPLSVAANILFAVVFSFLVSLTFAKDSIGL